MIVIALTGWGQEDDKRRADECGFDAHMIKPVEPARLNELLRKLLNERGRPGAFLALEAHSNRS
jgi:DNA-binding response OmpR family regulator